MRHQSRIIQRAASGPTAGGTRKRKPPPWAAVFTIIAQLWSRQRATLMEENDIKIVSKRAVSGPTAGGKKACEVKAGCGAVHHLTGRFAYARYKHATPTHIRPPYPVPPCRVYRLPPCAQTPPSPPAPPHGENGKAQDEKDTGVRWVWVECQ